MRYIVRNSTAGFLLSLIVAYFIRLWALDHGHKVLGMLAGIYMFILLFPVVIGLVILIIVLLFLFFKFAGSGGPLTGAGKDWKPFWFKNRTWTR